MMMNILAQNTKMMEKIFGESGSHGGQKETP